MTLGLGGGLGFQSFAGCFFIFVLLHTADLLPTFKCSLKAIEVGSTASGGGVGRVSSEVPVACGNRIGERETEMDDWLGARASERAG